MRRYLLCWLAPALLFLFSTAGFSQVLINEDFSTASGTTPPTGWSNNDLNSSGILWAFNNPGSRTFNAPITSPAAIFDSDDQGFSGGSEDATLETSTLDSRNGYEIPLTDKKEEFQILRNKSNSEFDKEEIYLSLIFINHAVSMFDAFLSSVYRMKNFSVNSNMKYDRNLNVNGIEMSVSW